MYQLELDDSSSGSGWSDIELEDVASIKFRAVTPPWQKISEQSGMSKQLRQRTAAAAAAATGRSVAGGAAGMHGGIEGLLGALWSEDNRDCNARLQEVRLWQYSPMPVVVAEQGPAGLAMLHCQVRCYSCPHRGLDLAPPAGVISIPAFPWGSFVCIVVRKHLLPTSVKCS